MLADQHLENISIKLPVGRLYTHALQMPLMLVEGPYKVWRGVALEFSHLIRPNCKPERRHVILTWAGICSKQQ